VHAGIIGARIERSVDANAIDRIGRCPAVARRFIAPGAVAGKLKIPLSEVEKYIESLCCAILYTSIRGPDGIVRANRRKPLKAKILVKSTIS